jgi:calcineurin-like phosphoesterase family protein
MKYFTADLHLQHFKILQYCNRPFDTIGEMNSTIIENINSVVNGDDTLYIVGDFCFSSSPKQIASYRNRLWCNNIVLLLGNHDKELRKNKKLQGVFSEVFDWGLEINEDSLRIIMCHYPFETWAGSNHGSLHLHGHSHGNLSPKHNRLDIGVDTNNFKPLSFKEVLEKIEEQNKVFKEVVL